jgi:hypothetical protein
MKKGTGETYEKLVDIKDYPDIGGSPETLETTTLSDSMQTYINGIQSSEAMEFTINYTSEIYDTISEMADTETDFAIWFGGTETGGVVTPTGDEGKFSFKGFISIRISGKGVNEVREAVISIAPSTIITKS